LKRAHKNLDVWKESMELAILVYRVTSTFPKSETYGLTGQMRRAAVSAPSNIAEGAARSPKEFAQFLTIAGGSLSELDTQIEIAFRLNYLTSQQYEELQSAMESIAIKLAGLISHVRRKAS
jgi:four helix bundle protein